MEEEEEKTAGKNRILESELLHIKEEEKSQRRLRGVLKGERKELHYKAEAHSTVRRSVREKFDSFFFLLLLLFS